MAKIETHVPFSIQKRGKSYRIRVFVGKDPKGNPIFQTKSVRPTGTTQEAIDKEVMDAGFTFYKMVVTGTLYDGDRITYADYVRTWEREWLPNHLTQSQKDDYKHVLKCRIIPVIGYIKINKINSQQLQSMVTDWEEEGLAPATIHRLFTICRSVLNYAYKHNIIRENPADRVDLPPLKRDNKLHYFDLEQSKTFLHALTLEYRHHYKPRERKTKEGNTYTVSGYDTWNTVPYQLQVYFNLAVLGGFRRGELIALTWEDIDFQEHRIYINKAAAHTAEGTIIKEPKTEAGNRCPVLPLSCFTMLQKWKQQQKEQAKLFGRDWKGYSGKDYDKTNVFIQVDGSMMDLYTPAAEFHKIIREYNALLEEKANQAYADMIKEGSSKRAALAEKERIMDGQLPYIRLHDLRHTSATLMIGEGVDIETVSRRLGHSKPSVTMDVYGHALPQKDREASAKLDRLFNDDQSDSASHGNKACMHVFGQLLDNQIPENSRNLAVSAKMPNIKKPHK